jgi:hypothetical protein
MAASTLPVLVELDAPEQEGEGPPEADAMEALLARTAAESLVGDTYLSGTSSTPRVRRTLFFPSSSPSAPAVDRTLSDPPLPSIPPHVLADPVIAGTIARAPHLFNVSTPLHVDLLERWLRPHPNRPLVDSVVQGLRQGFWPGLEGDLDQSDEDADLIVYAFDSGTAREDVLDLVRDAYEQLRTAGVDLRIQHIPGDFNTTADNLSRKPVPVLRDCFPSLTTFAPFAPSTVPSQEGVAR